MVVGPIRPLVGLILLTSLSTRAVAQSEVHIADDTLLDSSSPSPSGTRPVLFVHGHNLLSASDADFNYQKNWHEPNGQTSFKEAIEAPGNAWLDIEPYFIRFGPQNRSIVEDAREIGDAVERILARHDSNYVPFDASPATGVKIAIVAFSKGTISSRLYLKSLHQQQYDLPAPRAGFNPVSEFIALSPPNHGLASGSIAAFSLALKQLNNGHRDDCSNYLIDGAESLDFIELLNGHPIEDTEAEPFGAHLGEAPGSRANGAPSNDGTLYVSLYADGGRDFVGGNAPSGDCEGRIVAANLAPHAVNIEVAAIPGGTDGATVHDNTPHTPEVICLALSSIVHHRAPPEDFACTLSGGIPVIPPRAAVVLALDVSGSMLWPACTGCNPKLDVLQDAVELFAQLWSATAGPADRLGAALFGSNVAVFDIDGEPLLPVSDANVDAIVDHVGGQTPAPTHLTAMGGGLQRAIELLGTGAAGAIPQRHVILFTDGMQNVSPAVLEIDDSPPPGASHLEIDHQPAWTSSNVAPTQPPTRLDTIDVTVHTIGVGASMPFMETLTAIASATDGTSRFTLAPDDDLREFFVEEVIESLRGHSPQLVAYRRGTMKDEAAAEHFDIGRRARRLVLKLSWRRGQHLDFRVEKDGLDLTEHGRVTDGAFYRIFAIDLPASVTGRVVEPEGTWSMQVGGRAGIAYEVAAIVDEPALEYELRADRMVTVGTPLAIAVTLARDGQPIVNADRVVAHVRKPGESLGNLLADHASPPEPTGFALEGASAAQKKLHLLLRDDAIRRAIQPVSTTITLTEDEGGVYRGTFADTTIPGAYRIAVEIEGDDAAHGRFRRIDGASALVRFGTTMLASSDLRVGGLGRVTGGRRMEVHVRPTDAYGNSLGPDYGDRVAVSLSSGSIDSEVVDHLDGRYTVRLVVPDGDDPTLTLDVMGETVFAGRLSELETSAASPSRWWYLLILLILLVVVVVVIWNVRRGAS